MSKFSKEQIEEKRQEIWDAVNNNNVGKLRSAIRAYRYVNFVDKDGKTPLWIAAESGCVEIVKELLEVKSINIEIAPKSPEIYKGFTPLQIAIDRAMWGRTPREHELIAKVIVAAKERQRQRRERELQRQTESLLNTFGNLSVGQPHEIPSRRSRSGEELGREMEIRHERSRSGEELDREMERLSIRRDRSRSRDREGRGGKKISYKKKQSKNRSRRVK
jgi:hypothetical protein